jgi:hypothetical protein
METVRKAAPKKRASKVAKNGEFKSASERAAAIKKNVGKTQLLSKFLRDAGWR